MNRSRFLKYILVLIFAVVFSAQAVTQTDKDQSTADFQKANDLFRQANSLSDKTQQAQELYDQSIMLYEKIISQYGIKNSKLYYNLANAYLLRDNVGKAILNYLRAQKLDSNNPDIKKNLAFARSRRIDQIQVGTEQKVLKTLFFWHYDFSFKSRLIALCVCISVLFIALTIWLWAGRKPVLTVVTVLSLILTVCFAGSVLVENYIQNTTARGVILDTSVIARQGDGANYPQSFKDPLHEATEFELIEKRPGWLHIRLVDGNSAWIPDSSAAII